MAWTHIGTTDDEDVSNGGPAVARPAVPVGSQAGDLLMLRAVEVFDNLVADPPGYNRIRFENDAKATIWYRVATASEQAPEVASASGQTQQVEAILSAFRPPSGTPRLETANSQTIETGTTATTAPGIVTFGADDLLIHDVMWDGVHTHTPPAGFTDPGTSVVDRMATSYDLSWAAGATGDVAGALDSASNEIGAFLTAFTFSDPAVPTPIPTPTSRITLARPGWIDLMPLAVAGLDVTWAVEQAGRLSCFAPADAVARLGVEDVVGLWVRYEHPTQGKWAGVIEDEPGTIADGVVELTALRMRAGLFARRRAPVLFRSETATAGSLVRRGISESGAADPILLDAIEADEAAPVLEVEWRGDDLYDLMQQLAAQSGQEFDVEIGDDWSLTLVWREQLGRDQTDTVLLREGATVTDGRVDRSRTTITNDILGIANDAGYAQSSAVVVEDPASIARYGRLQSPVRRYEGVVTPATVRARAHADLRRERDGVWLPTVTVPALHPVARDIRHGDTVKYWSGVKHLDMDYRVMSRTVRDGTILELAGEATQVRRAPRLAPGFTPDQLDPVAWYDAADADTLTVINGRVWGWRDKSGHGHDLTAAGGSATQPGTLRTDALHGHPVIEFADNETLTRSSVDLSGTDQVSVYVVAKQVTAPASAHDVAAFGDTSADAGSWRIGREADDDIVAELRGNVGVNTKAGDAWGTTAFRRVLGLFNMGDVAGFEVFLVVDGGFTGAGPTTDNTGAFSANLALTVPLVTLSSGRVLQIAEVIIYPADHSFAGSDLIATVDAYLVAKWGFAP